MLLLFFPGILNAENNDGRFFSDDGEAATKFKKYNLYQVSNGTYYKVKLFWD